MGKVVAVAMSGGVDSSLSALLLKEQGYDVVALFMKNWEEEDHESLCTATEDYEDLVRVCEKIGIPHYTLNFSKEYREQVFSPFLEGLRKGITPNPDVLCNREIKFKTFFKKSIELGADYIATGHYAQTKGSTLIKSTDLTKDQTYFLYTLKSSMLPHLLFPVGHLKKESVRRIAASHQLITAEKKDSVGLCFIGKRKFSQFINRYIPYREGNILSPEKKWIGTHQGVPFYTIGQRKGLNIGGRADSDGSAWFVSEKFFEENIIHVVQGEKHPDLYRTKLWAEKASWISDIPPPSPFYCKAKIRYRQEEQDCCIELSDEGVLEISFLLPQRAVTPGQSIVFYQKEECLGGAIITQPSYLFA